MNLKFFINPEEISKEFKNFKAEVEAAVHQGVRTLSAMTHAKTMELAQEQLNTTREKYVKALDYQEIAPGIWVVSLDESALFIEEGRKSGDMSEDLLKNGAKIAKDGSRYKAIPFDYGKPSSQLSPFAKDMVVKIKDVLRKEGTSIKKIQYNADGSPRLGKIASYDIDSPIPSSRANTPALFGLSVFQSKGSNGKIRRDIMTFRVVSSKHKGSKWIHPGLTGKKLMDQALTWAESTWEREILPSIFEKFNT